MTAEHALQQTSRRFFGFQWHITNLCNLRCRHCYQDDFTKKDDLDFDAIMKIARKITGTLGDAGIHINLTGGEPLMRGDLLAILDSLMTIGNISEVNVITNGLLFDACAARKMNAMVKLKEIKISLEGADAHSNDEVRGRGVFDKVIGRIRFLKEHSIKKIFLMFTLGSYNYQALRRMLDLAVDLGVDGVIVERFVPWGRGLVLKEGYLKPGEWKVVLQTIIDFADLGVMPEDLLAYRAFRVCLGDSTELEGARCNVGEESMALMPQGDVYPCRRLPLRIGNIIEDDFGEIRLRLKLLRENIAANVLGKCKACKIADCRGCRAAAYALTGDLLAEDPQCFL